jgi:hypothetical protein
MVPDTLSAPLQQRRNGVLADVPQAERDLRYYNRNHNPGEPIQMTWNFDADVQDRDQPSEYDDTPPATDEPEI